VTPLTPDEVLALPKAELHVHLDGSLRPGTLLELARHGGVPLPADEEAALARAMRADDSADLVEYLRRFEWTLAVMQTAEALERIAYELAVDLAAENVWYAEVRYCPLLNTRGGLTPDETVAATVRGLRRAEADTGIHTGVILCGLRTFDPRTSVEVAHLAVSWKGRGVVGFDLAGAEAGHPPTDHLDAFRVAADGNLGVTIHAGEAWGARSIHEAIHRCGARRIGHGTRLLEDPGLMAYVADFRIPLEVCLTSNVQTGVTPVVSAHPFRRYLDAGVRLSLNTDNRLISGTTVTEEYLLAHTALGLTREELLAVTRMALEDAFLPLGERSGLLKRLDGV